MEDQHGDEATRGDRNAEHTEQQTSWTSNHNARAEQERCPGGMGVVHGPQDARGDVRQEQAGSAEAKPDTFRRSAKALVVAGRGNFDLAVCELMCRTRWERLFGLLDST